MRSNYLTLKSFARCFTVASLWLLATLARAEYVVENLTPTTDINEGVALAHAPDGRIFIAERSGQLKVYQNGQVSTVFTLSTVTDLEQGLLGITLHPSFAINGYLYIFYTKSDATRHLIERVRIDSTNRVVGRQLLMTLDPIENGFHNGGDLQFFEGFLYITTGDSQNSANSQNLDNTRGKILRVTENGQPAPDNPFYGSGTLQKQSIWCYGLRNPFRLVANAKAKKLFVLDVGNLWEEVNDITNPGPLYNYGWGHPQGGDGVQTETNLFVNPLFTFATGTLGNALTNGLLYNPDVPRYPASLTNQLIIKDFLRTEMRVFDWTQPNPVSTAFFNSPHFFVLGMSVGIDGYIYYNEYSATGNLMRLKYDSSALPTIVNQPQSQTVLATQPFSFRVDVSGSEPLRYQWQFNNVNIPDATQATFAVKRAVAAMTGSYRVVVSNAVGTVTSESVQLTVNPFNNAPTINITAPLPSLTWEADQVITFAATATDVEDGELDASRFKWQIDLFHEDTVGSRHSHPGASPQGVKSGTFVAGSQGEKSPNIWYRFILNVTDSAGITSSSFVDVYPRLISATAATVPAGLAIELNQKSANSPTTQQLVANANVQVLNAPTPQVIGNTRYDFVRWDHGGLANQTFTAPRVNTTYTARYQATTITEQIPYLGVKAKIAGRVEAENYDVGSEGYLDLNGGGDVAYRPFDGVGTQPCSEGGFNIGWVQQGEWLEYTVDVAQSGYYSLGIRYSTANENRRMHLEVDGVNVTGSVLVPNTFGWQNWQTKTVPGVRLNAGQRVIRVFFESDFINLDYLDFTLDTATVTYTPYGGSPAPIPGRIEAEEFDTDGEGIAYHDLTIGNSGKAFRLTESVDIQPSSAGTFNVGWIQQGEWLVYTIQVLEQKRYDMRFSVSTPYDAQSIYLALDGVRSSSQFVIPNTGGWQNWQEMKINSVLLPAGVHQLAVHFETGGVNFDFIDFSLSPASN
jgi:glucose/arabinose dehydrogenase